MIKRLSIWIVLCFIGSTAGAGYVCGDSIYIISPHEKKILCIHQKTHRETIIEVNHLNFFTLSVNYFICDHKLYISNVIAGEVTILHLPTLQVLKTLKVGKLPLALYREDTKGYVLNYNDTSVDVIDLQCDQIVAHIPHIRTPYAMGVWKNLGFITNKCSETVTVVDLETHQNLKTIDVGSDPHCLKVFNGRVYVVNALSNTVSVINAQNLTVIATIPVGEYPLTIAFKGDYAIVLNRNTKDISVIDITTSVVCRRIALEYEPHSFMFCDLFIFVTHKDTYLFSLAHEQSNYVQLVGGYLHVPTLDYTDTYIYAGVNKYWTRFVYPTHEVLVEKIRSNELISYLLPMREIIDFSIEDMVFLQDTPVYQDTLSPAEISKLFSETDPNLALFGIVCLNNPLAYLLTPEGHAVRQRLRIDVLQMAWQYKFEKAKQMVRHFLILGDTFYWSLYCAIRYELKDSIDFKVFFD